MGNYPLVARSQTHKALTSFTVDPDGIAHDIQDIAQRLGTALAAKTHGIPLKSMEFSLTITAEGKVGFLGTGASVSGEGCITLTFERA